MSDDLCFLSAVELRSRIARRELSPVEVTRAVLDRIERLQPELNCFITVCAEEALRESRVAEQMAMRGGELGLLHGVPYTAKDLVDTAAQI
jgi:aspartyl-tRNA(Asn)/glutamyl-tRNA(Gln) amidotransferase subunit A